MNSNLSQTARDYAKSAGAKELAGQATFATNMNATIRTQVAQELFNLGATEVWVLLVTRTPAGKITPARLADANIFTVLFPETNIAEWASKNLRTNDGDTYNGVLFEGHINGEIHYA